MDVTRRSLLLALGLPTLRDSVRDERADPAEHGFPDTGDGGGDYESRSCRGCRDARPTQL